MRLMKSRVKRRVQIKKNRMMPPMVKENEIDTVEIPVVKKETKKKPVTKKKIATKKKPIAKKKLIVSKKGTKKNENITNTKSK